MHLIHSRNGTRALSPVLIALTTPTPLTQHPRIHPTLLWLHLRHLCSSKQPLPLQILTFQTRMVSTSITGNLPSSATHSAALPAKNCLARTHHACRKGWKVQFRTEKNIAGEPESINQQSERTND